GVARGVGADQPHRRGADVTERVDRVAGGDNGNPAGAKLAHLVANQHPRVALQDGERLLYQVCVRQDCPTRLHYRIQHRDRTAAILPIRHHGAGDARRWGRRGPALVNYKRHPRFPLSQSRLPRGSLASRQQRLNRAQIPGDSCNRLRQPVQLGAASRTDDRMAPMRVSLQQARRFALMAQGLLPFLPFQGPLGTEQAVRQMGYLQLDTVNVVERSHDLALLSRVRDYQKSYLWDLAYGQRRLMEYCQPLLIVPTDEYPFFRTTFPGHDPWHGDAHAELLAPVVARVRAELEARGPLSARQLEGQKMAGGYGVVKDATRALWRLWYGGEILTHHRDANFGRYYDLTPRCLPDGAALEPVDEPAARRFLARRTLALLGIGAAADFAPLPLPARHAPPPLRRRAPGRARSAAARRRGRHRAGGRSPRAALRPGRCAGSARPLRRVAGRRGGGEPAGTAGR